MVSNPMCNVLVRSVISGMTGYFVFPENDALLRLVRKNPWLRVLFLFLMVWQSPTGGNMVRTVIATAIIYVLVTVVVPAIDSQ